LASFESGAKTLSIMPSWSMGGMPPIFRRDPMSSPAPGPGSCAIAQAANPDKTTTIHCVALILFSLF
jgi:hypothetical protein